MKQIKTLTALFAVFFLLGISPQVCASHAMAQLLLAEEGTECDHSYSNGFCTLCGVPCVLNKKDDHSGIKTSTCVINFIQSSFLGYAT